MNMMFIIVFKFINIVGGCCGHSKLFRRGYKDFIWSDIKEDSTFVNVGERTNVTGWNFYT